MKEYTPGPWRVEYPYNQQMIAAAPEMYEALLQVEWVFVGEDYQCSYCHIHEGYKHDNDCLVSNAIKKARGEK